ncbi:MAG: hypothetical protein V3V81_01670 [Candidatus Bathyarchaeia archaeon]
MSEHSFHKTDSGRRELYYQVLLSLWVILGAGLQDFCNLDRLNGITIVSAEMT